MKLSEESYGLIKSSNTGFIAGILVTLRMFAIIGIYYDKTLPCARKIEIYLEKKLVGTIVT